MKRMSRFGVYLLGLALSLPAMAQTSTFTATANGTPQPVPALVAEDLAKPSGRAVVTITPAAITTGSQHFLRANQWGFWLWQDELHMQFYTPAGERRLVRINDDVEGVTVPAGQPTTFEASWSPEGVGVFVEGELRAYLAGDFVEPGAPVYGAAPNGNAPYSGGIKVDVFAEPASYDPCTNYPNWGTVQQWDAAGNSQGGQALIPQPTCQTVPPDEPVLVIDGVATPTFSWAPPTENEDGSALSVDAIKEYRLFWGNQSRIGRCSDGPSDPIDAACYPNMMTIQGGSSSSQQLTLSIDEDVTFYFSMITVVDGENAQGDPVTLVSKWSNEVARAFDVVVTEPPPPPDPTPTPTPPTTIDVTVELTCTTNVPGVTCEITVVEPQ